METAIRTGTMQVTMLCLVAAGTLLALGVAGIPASPALVVVLLALSVGLYLTRPEATVGRRFGVDIDSLLSSLWLAPSVAAFPLLLESAASPAEVQALGGLVGLVGMSNYFLRPVYLLAHSLGQRLREWASVSTDR